MKVHGLGDQNQPCTPEEPILETIRSSAMHRPLTLDYLVLPKRKLVNPNVCALHGKEDVRHYILSFGICYIKL